MTTNAAQRVTTTPNAPRLRRGRRHLLLALAAIAAAGAIAAAWFLLARQRPAQPTPPSWPTAMSTVAGVGAPGLAEGCGAQAAFADPFGIAVDESGLTYVADAADNNVIWRIDANGCARVLAGGREGLADGDGRDAAFDSPSGLAIDRNGDLIVADTGNHAIRRVTRAGHVATIAGAGQPGNADGRGVAAQFNGPIGVAVAPDGRVIVADTYNDSIRAIAADGTVTTLAGGRATGYRDGDAADALFDTPSGVAVSADGTVYVADTGNDAIRRIDPNGEVTTIGASPSSLGGTLQRVDLFRPVGIALGCAGGAGDLVSFQFLPCESGKPATQVADSERSRVAEKESRPGLIIVTDGAGRVLALSMTGEQRMSVPAGEAPRPHPFWIPFRNPTGVAIAPDGSLRVADSDNYLIRRLSRPGDRVAANDIDFTPVPWLNAATLNMPFLPWPVDPQHAWHEVAATLGEARGSSGGDGRARLHTGIDVKAFVGSVVRAVRDEKVQRPIAATGFDNANEALRVGAITYVHVRVGRTASRKSLDSARFPIVTDDAGKPERVRVRRGTRFHVGDAIGTVNRFAHVHLDVGPRGGEINPLGLSLEGFHDALAPIIPPRGIEFYTEAGEPIVQPPKGRVPLFGRVAIVVEAYDRVDGNGARRKLGVYRLGYQVLKEDGTPAPGFEAPRMTIEFDRLPDAADAPQLIYAEGSGITVYGNKTTRFRYIVTNELREGRVTQGLWDTTQLQPGEYRLRAFAGDASGNETSRDVSVILVR